jgi:hypothetical protein
VAGTADAGSKDAFEQARDRLRETIKWLVASFGAIGASLALGTQISNIGGLSAGRLSIAIVSALGAFIGVFAAMWKAVSVLTGSHITIGDLARESERGARQMEKEKSRLLRFFEEDNKHILRPYGSLKALYDDFLKVQEGKDDDAYNRVAEHVGVVVNAASYERLRFTFNDALRWIMVSLALAAVAILIFAWAANPVDEEEEAATAPASLEAAAAAPYPARLSLTPTGREVVQSSVGPDCTGRQIDVLVLGGDRDAVDVVTLPTAKCSAARFVITAGLGTLTAADPVCRIVEQEGHPRRLQCGVAP